MVQQPLLTPQRAAKILGTTVATLAAWRVRGGKLPYIKLGRAVRYKPEDVESFINAGRHVANSEDSPRDE